jgi:hypothetical protein
MPTKLELEIKNAERNELLLQAIDAKVLAGKMRIEAAKDCYDLYSAKCQVHTDTLQVVLDGLPLSDALDKILATRTLWVPQGDDPAIAERKQLEGDVIAGSVSAHGRAFREWGEKAYQAFVATNSAKLRTPGEKLKAPAGDKTNIDNTDDRKNPWLAGQWSVTEQGRIAKTLGIAVAQRMASAAGVHVGATRPVKAA